MRDPYEVLGVSRTATPEEIRTAYRSAAQRAHPDREGGDADRMAEVNAAFDVLRDPESRARFDRTGSTQRGASLDARAAETLRTMLRELILQQPPERLDSRDLFDELQFRLNDNRRTAEEQLRQADLVRAAVARSRARLRVKADDFLGPVFADLDSQGRTIAADVRDRLAVLERAEQLLQAGYEDAGVDLSDPATLPPTPSPPWIIRTFGTGTGT